MARGQVSLALFALVAASSALETPDTRFLVLPPPREIAVSGGARALHSDFAIECVEGCSDRLQRSIDRHMEYISSRLGAPSSMAARGAAPALSKLRVRVAEADTVLGPGIDESHALRITEGSDEAEIRAATPFGAMHALESFRQLLSRGGSSLPHSGISIADSPSYSHRGLMLDTGRRFFPVPLLHNLLDTMATVKLSVLHWHLSDHCRFSVESSLYPNLTSVLTGVLGGYYSTADVADVVGYAMDRGIRVVPEFDVPGHARGMLPLAGYGAQFCTPGSPTTSQMYGDPANQTYNIVTSLFAEVSPLFPDPYFHIGADETSAVGPCTVDSTFSFERAVLEFVQQAPGAAGSGAGGLNKTGAGWEEILFDAGAATNETIVYAWSRHNPPEILAQGRRAVNSNGTHYYFTRPAGSYPDGWVPTWFDIAEGVQPDQMAGLLGGEMSMWTDTYCYIQQCGSSTGPAPPAAELFPPSADAQFATSVAGMIWPRGFVGASSFWNFNSSVSATDPSFVAAVWSLNDQVAAQGGLTCPTNCSCDQLTQCGQPIVPPSPPPAAGATLHVTSCTLPLPQSQSFFLNSTDGTLRAGTPGSALCVASPGGATGNPSYPLRLADCAGGSSAGVLTWTRPAPGSPGGSTARLIASNAGSNCLDMSDSSDAVGLYACGSGSGLVQLNQGWALDTDSSGAVLSFAGAGCLTAVGNGTALVQL